MDVPTQFPTLFGVAMRLKNPGGDLTWLTPLWVLAGGGMAFLSARGGSPWFAALYASFAACALLVWFDIRWVAKPLITYFGLAVLAGIAMLFVKGFSLGLAGRLILIGYTIAALWKWGRERSPMDQAVSWQAHAARLSEAEDEDARDSS